MSQILLPRYFLSAILDLLKNSSFGKANKHIEILSCHNSVVQIMKDDNLGDTARKDIT